MNPNVWTRRIGALARGAAERGWAGVALGPGDDLRWATGSGMSSIERLTLLVVPADGSAPTVVVPRLELASLGGSLLAADGPAVEAGDVVLAPWVDGQDPYAVAAAALGTGEGAAATVGVDDALPARHLLPLADRGVRPVLAGAVVAEHRMVKDADELQALRDVGAAIDRVHARMGEFLRVGRTEAEVAADLAAAILAEGHVSVDFVIVGSGAHGADPHHDVSDKRVEAGEIVVVDIGGTAASGYHSDCTRTYVMGEPADPEAAAQVGTLRAAMETSVDVVRPGVSAAAIDAAARGVLAEAGLAERFIHRTGHGIGLSGHEEPFIVGGNDLPVQAGMAFSIEPGIYDSGRWGARIEDIVLVTADGVESVNRTDHGLTRLDA